MTWIPSAGDPRGFEEVIAHSAEVEGTMIAKKTAASTEWIRAGWHGDSVRDDAGGRLFIRRLCQACQDAEVFKCGRVPGDCCSGGDLLQDSAHDFSTAGFR